MLAYERFLPSVRVRLPRLPLRYIIADRYTIVREGVKSILDDCVELECVGQVSSGGDLLTAICLHKPDLLLTGLLLEDVSVLTVLRHCRLCMPEMGIVVLSMSNHPLTMAECASAGAHGFVSKDDSSERLIEVILRVAAGERGVFPPNANLGEPALTERARRVLYGITSGLATGDIAEELCVSVKTVELYRTQLLRRFGLRKSTDLVRFALQSGIVLSAKTASFSLREKDSACRQRPKGQQERRSSSS